MLEFEGKWGIDMVTTSTWRLLQRGGVPLENTAPPALEAFATVIIIILIHICATNI